MENEHYSEERRHKAANTVLLYLCVLLCLLLGIALMWPELGTGVSFVVIAVIGYVFGSLDIIGKENKPLTILPENIINGAQSTLLTTCIGLAICAVAKIAFPETGSAVSVVAGIVAGVAIILIVEFTVDNSKNIKLISNAYSIMTASAFVAVLHAHYFDVLQIWWETELKLSGTWLAPVMPWFSFALIIAIVGKFLALVTNAIAPQIKPDEKFQHDSI